MSRKRQPYHFTFGPPIPVVPIGDFSRHGLTEQEWADVWAICGPTAEKNMSGMGPRKPPLQLWQVIAAAYLEGLNHGYGMAQEKEPRP